MEEESGSEGKEREVLGVLLGVGMAGMQEAKGKHGVIQSWSNT